MGKLTIELCLLLLMISSMKHIFLFETGDDWIRGRAERTFWCRHS